MAINTVDELREALKSGNVGEVSHELLEMIVKERDDAADRLQAFYTRLENHFVFIPGFEESMVTFENVKYELEK